MLCETPRDSTCGIGAARARADSDRKVCAFGHIGDGNIHFNLTQPVDADKTEFLSRWSEFNRIVHDVVVEMGGSISAEHGIGLLKRDELSHYKSETELALMRRVKNAIDRHFDESSTAVSARCQESIGEGLFSECPKKRRIKTTTATAAALIRAS